MAENGAAEAPKTEDPRLLEEEDDDEELEADQGADFVWGASSCDGPSVTSPEHVSNERGGDSTECSSSFADSFCETGDEAEFGDLEVNSPFSVHADGGQASALPRKKKVTADWRNAVRPMLWRCEWLELRMKDLLSQVSKYDSQLALIKQEKELQRAISKTESGKSCRGLENISMERRKRKRDEDTVDTSLYLKKHQILSYFFDKQNKGAEKGGLLIDDDSHGPVEDAAKGLRDIAGLPASKECDMVSKQFILQKILLKIAGIQSRVHRLQERLSKACSKQAKLASCMDHAQVNVAEKRQRTQKRAYSPTNDRYAKPQKKKKLNILLEQEDRLALSVKPTLSERATDCVKEEPQGNSEEKAAEKSQAHKKAITADILLGVESSLPNGHLGDLCKENADDILIDNRGAEEGYQPFENVKHPLEKPPMLAEDVAKTPSKAENTSEPAKAEKISVPVVKQEQIPEKPPALMLVYTGKKWRRQPRPEDMGSAAASKNHNKEAFTTPAAKQKAQSTPRAENENAGSEKQKTMDTRASLKKLNLGNSSSSAAKTPKTGNSSSAAKTPKTVNSLSNGKKQTTGNSSSTAKTPKTGNLSSDGNKRAAGNSSAAAKKPRTGNSSSDGKKHAAGNTPAPAARKEMSGNIPTNMRIEKAILVEVNSRRSQRVRKPKVY